MLSSELLRLKTKADVLKSYLAQLRKAWEESKHPRDDRGRFAYSSGASSKVNIDTFLTHNQAHEAAHGAAEKLGFNRSLLHVLNERDFRAKLRQAEPSMVKHARSVVGFFDPRDGTVTMNSGAMRRLTKSFAIGSAIHEINHAKFHAFDDAVSRDVGRLKQDAGRLMGSDILSMSQRTGKMPDSLKGKYLTLEKWVQVMGSSPAKRKLRRTDGVTEYSTQYWKQSKYDIFGDSETIAINETLSEMARLKYQGGKLVGAKPWRDLYQAIDDHWQKLHA